MFFKMFIIMFFIYSFSLFLNTIYGIIYNTVAELMKPRISQYVAIGVFVP